MTNKKSFFIRVGIFTFFTLVLVFGNQYFNNHPVQNSNLPVELAFRIVCWFDAMVVLCIIAGFFGMINWLCRISGISALMAKLKEVAIKKIRQAIEPISGSFIA